jgi:RimJ/RimL family protein N-acetyltransferase
MTETPIDPTENQIEAQTDNQPGTPADTAQAWVPIRTLSAHHRDAVLAHLLALPERDRYLRFGYQASDPQIGNYVQGLDFDRDDVFGVFNRRLEIVALAHVAYPDRDSAHAHPAEFGGSVLPQLRGRSIGTQLFAHAMLHIRNRGMDTIYIHALSENQAMLSIARRAGATVERSGTESDAYLRLPHGTFASHADALVGEGAAVLDYGFKQQALMVGTLLDAITEVKTGVGKTGRTGVD